MEVPLAARLVEIIADDGEDASPRYRFGSGCIVVGRTVLTAAHVVSGAVSVRIRTIQKNIFAASVDPQFVGHSDGPGPDFALIEIDYPAMDLPPLELARLDRNSAIEAAVNCHTYGYPWFGERRSPDVTREMVDAVGVIAVLSKLTTGLASVQVQDSPRELPADDLTLAESAWAGMSGGPVISGGHLLGVVIEHAPREGQSTITMAPISLLERHADYPLWGAGVTNLDGWWRKLGVGGSEDLVVLPGPTAEFRADVETELAADAMEYYRVALTSAGVLPPAVWNDTSLSRIMVKNHHSRATDLISALRRAIAAKRVLTKIGIDQLGLAQLQVIYRREVGTWPGDGAVDKLLVQAAEVEENERRTGANGALAPVIHGDLRISGC